MADYIISRAEITDELTLCDMFLSHISENTAYISHGEIQMGVGVGHFENGVLVTAPSPKARECWLKYIHGNLTEPDRAMVYKAVGPDGAIVGFCVVEIQEDGADPFGMVCDVLVKDEVRGTGVGTTLLETALSWLDSMGVKDVYLESGLKNHAAHEYFMRRGFIKVSEIYKLQR